MEHFDYSQRRKAKVLSILFILTLAFCIILQVVFMYDASEKSVVINEICSNNFSLYMDDAGNYPDYIELYNAGDTVVSTDGMFLSDDEKDLQKLPLDNLTLQPGERFVIWLSDKTDGSATAFKLNSLGETLFLCNNDRDILDSVNVPKLQYNTSYGRVKDGGDAWSVMSTTVGKTNNEAQTYCEVKLSPPVFSVESGFYNEDFALNIEAKKGEKIYYTLDGSVPTQNSTVYDGPIWISDVSNCDNIYAARTDLSPTRSYTPSFPVDKATVLRAICYNENDNSISETVTKVYFLGYSEKKEYDKLPIISLVADPKDLFDDEYGIYVNGNTYDEYMQNGGLEEGVILNNYTDEDGNIHNLYEASNAFKEGKEWEREAAITYFDDSHTYCFEQNIGIRIAGASTRGTPQKSFGIYGRDIYDEQIFFPQEIFPGANISTLKLRNGGDDNAHVKIKDAFLEGMVEDRNVSVQRTVPCVVFLNGEYWGIYNIRERYTEEYIWNYYNVNKDNVWIIDSGVAKNGDAAAREAYEYMLSLVTECDLTYDDVYAMVTEQLDVQSLIDYCCINLYTDNQDISFVQNMALWRTSEYKEERYHDGKWRWMLFDMDDTLHDYSEMEPSAWMQNYCLLNEPVMQSFMKNEQFRKQFCITLMDIANVNFAYERVHENLVSWKEVYGSQIVKNHQRFFDADFNRQTFDSYVDEMDSFFENRFSYVMKGMKDYFDLEGTLEVIEINCQDSKAGNIYVNSSQINVQKEWKGEYYSDYPVTLTATPANGYKFVGWSGDICSGEETMEVILPQGGVSLQAIFEKEE